MKFYIRRSSAHYPGTDHLCVDIDSSGMSVVWTDARCATVFPTVECAASVVKRVRDRYGCEPYSIYIGNE